MFGSRFTPRLEQLGARVNPGGGVRGGDISWGQVAVAADAGHVSPDGIKGGMSGDFGHVVSPYASRPSSTGDFGQVAVGHGAWVGHGHVDPYASRPNSGGNINI